MILNRGLSTGPPGNQPLVWNFSRGSSLIKNSLLIKNFCCRRRIFSTDKELRAHCRTQLRLLHYRAADGIPSKCSGDKVVSASVRRRFSNGKIEVQQGNSRGNFFFTLIYSMPVRRGCASIKLLFLIDKSAKFDESYL